MANTATPDQIRRFLDTVPAHDLPAEQARIDRLQAKGKLTSELVEKWISNRTGMRDFVRTPAGAKVKADPLTKEQQAHLRRVEQTSGARHTFDCGHDVDRPVPGCFFCDNQIGM